MKSLLNGDHWINHVHFIELQGCSDKKTRTLNDEWTYPCIFISISMKSSGGVSGRLVSMEPPSAVSTAMIMDRSRRQRKYRPQSRWMERLASTHERLPHDDQGKDCES